MGGRGRGHPIRQLSAYFWEADPRQQSAGRRGPAEGARQPRPRTGKWQAGGPAVQQPASAAEAGQGRRQGGGKMHRGGDSNRAPTPTPTPGLGRTHLPAEVRIGSQGGGGHLAGRPHPGVLPRQHVDEGCMQEDP